MGVSFSSLATYSKPAAGHTMSTGATDARRQIAALIIIKNMCRLIDFLVGDHCQHIPEVRFPYVMDT